MCFLNLKLMYLFVTVGVMTVARAVTAISLNSSLPFRTYHAVATL